MSRLALGWLAAGLVGLVLFAYGAADDGPPQTNADRAYALANDFACPVCNGQSVAESDASIARIIRADIRQQVDEGRTDDEITAYLRSRFPDDIALTPPASGFAGLVWVLPVVAIVAAVAGLVVVFRRWSADAAEPASDDDAALVEAAQQVREDH